MRNVRSRLLHEDMDRKYKREIMRLRNMLKVFSLTSGNERVITTFEYSKIELLLKCSMLMKLLKSIHILEL